mgnify:FL=1
MRIYSISTCPKRKNLIHIFLFFQVKIHTMSNENNEPQCPICKGAIAPSAREGIYVCYDCVNSGTFTEDGRKIDFGNIDHTGGFESRIEGETTNGREHYCYIKRGDNRFKVVAGEARFGGIVYHLCREQDVDEPS